MSKLKSLLWMVLSAAPFLLVFPGCGFNENPGPMFDPGDPPRTTAIFCDIETTRRCATPEDRRVGVDVSKPFQDGFWIGKSSVIGLDYVPNGLMDCQGEPQAVVYKDPFPAGSPVCLNPDEIPERYADLHVACQEWCFSLKLIDADLNPYRCENISRRSNGVADQGFRNACEDAGTKRGDFRDPRKPSSPVGWTVFKNAKATGSNLEKEFTVPPDPAWGDSGAVSVQELTETEGDGSVLVTASETSTFRIFGLGRETPGNVTDSYDDIEFGLLMTNEETSPNESRLFVIEPGVPPRLVGTYVTGDVLEVGVFGGTVQYRKNTTYLHTSTQPITYPLRVEAALYNQGATLQAARISF